MCFGRLAGALPTELKRAKQRYKHSDPQKRRIVHPAHDKSSVFSFLPRICSTFRGPNDRKKLLAPEHCVHDVIWNSSRIK